MRSFQRERRIICGRTKSSAQYQEIEIYPMNGTEECRELDREIARNPRGTPEAQKKQNARAALRHFVQLLATNFTEQDTHTVGTYAPEMLPADLDQAERDYNNFLRHIATKCRAKHLPRPEALGMVEWQNADPENGKKAVRFHIHVVLRCGLARDEIESCWHRKGKRLGLVNADRLQMDKGSLEALAGYLLKYTNRKHRWHRTRGIVDPIKPKPNDDKYSRRLVAKIATDSALLNSPDYWARKYPGWELNEAEARYNEFTGWHISLKMRRRKEVRRRGG